VPWFRKKGKEQPAPEQAAAVEAPTPEESDLPAAQRSEEQADTKPKRRRGTRGGRGRKKKTPDQPSGEEAPEAAERPPAEKRAGRRPASPEAGKAEPKPRRRREPKRAALPPVKKEILVSVEVGETRVAVLEDGRPAEVYLERRGRRSIAGNIYKGVVDNVLPGMEASFVEIGLEKNGFLYVDEIVVPELEGKRHGKRIQELIERGQEVLVQAVKDPMGTKGARLTTEISLPGRFVVYTPYGEGIGVSRRLEDAERDRLKAICKELELPEGGIIVRTAAEGASHKELEGDLALLRKLWGTIRSRAERAEAPALVYREAEIPLRVVRDLFIRDFERVLVDHDRTYRRIVGYLKRMSPELAARVELHDGAEPLMDVHGVDDAIRSTLSRRVDLPSGGYLIFDYAEAFTVVDVNTGRFVGSRGKSSGARLEETITKNNLEAVTEVVRQLRLRDIGGIIVIDFIDMANPKNRQLVEDALRAELERDRTKTYVVEISPLGLVEMTRQNVTDGPREILTTKCPTCAGDGIVLSAETAAIQAERKLRRLLAASPSESFLVELNAHVAGILIGSGGSRLTELEAETGRRFAFETKETLPHDHFRVLAQGSAAEIEQQGLPVSPGQELMVKLEQRHLQNDDDAIARLDGYVIAVAGAGPKVGRRMKIRIERATRTSAYAVLTSAKAAEKPVEAADIVQLEEADEEIPAPKPRRSRAKKPDAVTPALQEAGEFAVQESEVAPEGPTADEAVAEAPKKKRTRRGSRGGRGRKKKTLEVTTAEADEPVEAIEEAAETSTAAPETAPPETAEPEAPAPETLDGEVPRPKKRTRRGSRGGRGRKRRPAAANGSESATAEGEQEPTLDPVASFAGPEEDG